MTSNKRYYVAIYDELDFIDLAMLENIFRTVVGNTPCYIKYNLITDNQSKPFSEWKSVDFSAFSMFLDLERKNFNLIFINNFNSSDFYHICVYNKVDDSRVAVADLYDFAILLYMDIKTKEILESKYGLHFVTEEEYNESIGLK